MTEPMPNAALTEPTADGLKVLVGCEFRFDAAASVAAIIQVAPSPHPGVRMRREEWHTVPAITATSITTPIAASDS